MPTGTGFNYLYLDLYSHGGYNAAMFNVQENLYDIMFDYLKTHGWTYMGADEWCDPITSLKYLVSIAYQIEIQRKYDKQRRLKYAWWMV